jgi:glycosyltransferase involved in cell wall biosynthesis
MKIAVHSQVLTAPSLFGIGYYLYNLLNAIGQIQHQNEFLLYSGYPLHFTPEGNAISSRPKAEKIPSKCFSYFGFPWMASKEKCDLAFLPKEVTPFGLSIPTVITAYDLYALKMPKELKGQFPRTSRIHYQLAKLLHFKRASKILAISQDTKNDLMDLCGIPENKIVVTPLGADPLFFDRVT